LHFLSRRKIHLFFLWRFGALAFRYGALYPPRPFEDKGSGSLMSRLAQAALRFRVPSSGGKARP
jgi:hypothetical protein